MKRNLTTKFFKSKVLAFTLSELLIGMIVLSFAVSVGYYCVEFSIRQFNIFHHRKMEEIDLQLFSNTFYRDLNKASRVIIPNDSTVVLKDTLETIYVFSSRVILRNSNNVLQRFFLVAQFKKNKYFSGKIMALSIDFLKPTRNTRKFIKHFSSEQLLENKAILEHEEF